MASRRNPKIKRGALHLEVQEVFGSPWPEGWRGISIPLTPTSWDTEEADEDRSRHDRRFRKPGRNDRHRKKKKVKYHVRQNPESFQSLFPEIKRGAELMRLAMDHDPQEYGHWVHHAQITSRAREDSLNRWISANSVIVVLLAKIYAKTDDLSLVRDTHMVFEHERKQRG